MPFVSRPMLIQHARERMVALNPGPGGVDHTRTKAQLPHGGQSSVPRSGRGHKLAQGSMVRARRQPETSCSGCLPFKRPSQWSADFPRPVVLRRPVPSGFNCR